MICVKVRIKKSVLFGQGRIHLKKSQKKEVTDGKSGKLVVQESNLTEEQPDASHDCRRYRRLQLFMGIVLTLRFLLTFIHINVHCFILLL